jgi:uncharacterized protein YegJ (DUF2314 family)
VGPRGFDNSRGARLHSVTCVLACALAVAACTGNPPPAPVTVKLEDRRPEVERIAIDDPLTAKGIVEARKTASEFLRAYRARGPSQRDFRFKMLAAEKGLVEQYWVTLESAADDSFTGIVANHPGDITGVKYSERVTVPASEISDWMYVENGVLKGGYSVRLMRDRLQPEERPAFERELGFRID